MDYLGKRIKNARMLAGFTQEYVAEHVGVSRTAITRWENGEIEPRLEHLVLLAGVLDVSTDHLLGVNISDGGGGLNISEEASVLLRKFIEEIRKENNSSFDGGKK